MTKRKNILEALYYGEIAPYEKCFAHDAEYEKCVKTIFTSEEKLNARLNEEGRELLSGLMDAEGDLSEFSILDYFVEGFRLGARIMLDTFLPCILAPSAPPARRPLTEGAPGALTCPAPPGA